MKIKFLKPNKAITETLIIMVVIFITFIYLLPYIYVVTSAFKTRVDILAASPRWIFSPTLKNLEAVIGGNFFFYVKNTMIICLANTAITLLLAIPAAYAFSRYKFRFKERLFVLFLILQMVPGISLIIGFYIMATTLGIYDTHLLLIIVYLLWNVPFAIWMLRGFLEGVPPEVEEQALVDGYTRFGALFHVTLPLAAPGLGAVSIFLFILSWNEFTLPFFLSEFAARPVSLTTMFYTTHAGVLWGEMFALCFLVTLPVILFALLVRKTYVKALTFGAVKG